MSSWLDTILDQHKDYESPMNFWRWGALAAISAVMKDQIWLDRYLYKLYPNVFIIFHAESGLKKGPPVAMANKLVKFVNNTHIIKGRSSIQAILKDMANSYTLPGGRIKDQSCVFICSPELSSSLVEDPVAAKILTDLFDRHANEDDWRQLLKQDTFVIKNPTVTLLGATNEAMSEDFFTGVLIKGGFFARTFIIYESKRNKVNSLAHKPKQIPNYEESAKYLKELSKLKGQFKYFSDTIESDYYCRPITIDNEIHYYSEAGFIYENWYREFINVIDNQEIKDETGTLNRFGDAVLKVAMLLSLAEAPVLEISVNAMNEAIKICEQLLGNVRKTTMNRNGLSTSSSLKALIINELLNVRENHQITRTMLTKKFYLHYSSTEELDSIMESFHVAGLITTEVRESGTIYTMPNSQVEQLRLYLAGKGNKRQ